MRAKSIFAVPSCLSDTDRQQRRHALVRLSLAWLAMMQVMMFAWPGYLRHDSMPADALETLDWAIVLMNWASFALTIPVVLYSAWPIWRHAGDNLRQGRAGMDVPVALGIVAAFIPSVHATWTGRGEVYFDSVTMFVAFLLTARYLELCARQSFGGAAGGLRHQRVEAQRLDLGARADRLASRFVLAQVALALAAAIGRRWRTGRCRAQGPSSHRQAPRQRLQARVARIWAGRAVRSVRSRLPKRRLPRPARHAKAGLGASRLESGMDRRMSDWSLA